MINFIKEERKKQHLTQKELSEASGVPATTIANWENRNVVPPVDKFAKVLNALGYALQVVKKESIFSIE